MSGPAAGAGRHESPDPVDHGRPRAVLAAVTVLGLQALSGLLSLVHDLVLGLPLTVEALVGVATNVVISALLGWFLWRASDTARGWAIVLTALGLLVVAVAVAIAGIGPPDLYLAWTLVDAALGVALLVLLFRPETRRWCRRRRAERAHVAARDHDSSKEE